MFRVEVERSDGVRVFLGGGNPTEWRYPEEADAVAEKWWNAWCGDDLYVRFSVVEQDGTVYSDWEV
jgi:hypothetical protein